MQLTSQEKVQKNGLLTGIKSFLIWSFTLSVCLLVVGFPVGFVLVSIGVLAVMVLHTVMPISSVIFVAAIIAALNVLAVLLGAAVLAVKGINPKDVTWLSWLHGDAEPKYETTYASCPISCDMPEQK